MTLGKVSIPTYVSSICLLSGRTHAVVGWCAMEAGLREGPLTLGCVELRHLGPCYPGSVGISLSDSGMEATAQISLLDQALGTSSSMLDQ